MYTAIYARQSLDKKDSMSIDGQIELCRREASGEFKVFTDKGFSGKNTHRPSFEKLMQAVENGEVEKLVCYRLDRVSRSILDFGVIWDTLSRNKVEFVSVNEKFDTSTPSGRAMLYIIMVFAQLERETIAERIKDNYYQRVKKGAWPGGPAPFGFQIAEKRVEGKRVLEPTPEIEIVKRIFDLYAEAGASLGKVAKILTQEGIPCSKRKSWDSVSVCRILKNPAYVQATSDVYMYYKARGLIIYNEVEEFTGKNGCIIVGKRSSNERKYTDMTNHLLALSAHEGIINSEQFLTCQYRLNNNKQLKNTGGGKLTWLSGLLHCSNCGYSIRVIEDKRSGKRYLSCSGRTNYHVCDIKHTEKIEDIESAVEEYILNFLGKNQLQKPPKSNEPSERNKYMTELEQIESKISNLIEALAEGNEVSVRYINSALKKLDESKRDILRKLAESTIANPRERPVVYDFKSLDFDAKKAVCKNLIENVVCSPTSIEIIMR